MILIKNSGYFIARLHLITQSFTHINTKFESRHLKLDILEENNFYNFEN